MDIIEFEQELERQEMLEHRDVLLAISSLLKTNEGKTLFKYLFKNLEVITTPENGMKGEELHEYLGFLKAGNSIYKLTCEADYKESALILSELERKRYDDKIRRYQIENSINTN